MAGQLPKKLKVGVLISGRGSNLKSLLDTCAAPDFPAQIVTVISNRPGAGGLDHARAASVPAQAIDHKAYDGKPAFEAAITAALEAAGIELLCLAGFMRVVSAGFVQHWQGRMINIHPSLLPLFPGLDTHARALAAGVKLHGCSVHYVTEEVDGGPIVGQAGVGGGGPGAFLRPQAARLTGILRGRPAGPTSPARRPGRAAGRPLSRSTHGWRTSWPMRTRRAAGEGPRTVRAPQRRAHRRGKMSPVREDRTRA